MSAEADSIQRLAERLKLALTWVPRDYHPDAETSLLDLLAVAERARTAESLAVEQASELLELGARVLEYRQALERIAAQDYPDGWRSSADAAALARDVLGEPGESSWNAARGKDKILPLLKAMRFADEASRQKAAEAVLEIGDLLAGVAVLRAALENLSEDAAALEAQDLLLHDLEARIGAMLLGFGGGHNHLEDIRAALASAGAPQDRAGSDELGSRPGDTKKVSMDHRSDVSPQPFHARLDAEDIEIMQIDAAAVSEETPQP